MTVFAWILLISCCCHLAATIVTSIFDDDVPGMIVGILASVLAGLFLAVYLFIAPLGVVWTGIAIGIAVGVVGCGLLVAAYPSYVKISALQKKKYGAEILHLCEELLVSEQNLHS